jgi:hypothetical protein
MVGDTNRTPGMIKLNTVQITSYHQRKNSITKTKDKFFNIRFPVIPNVTDEKLTFLIHIWDDPGSNLDPRPVILTVAWFLSVPPQRFSQSNSK